MQKNNKPEIHYSVGYHQIPKKKSKDRRIINTCHKDFSCQTCNCTLDIHKAKNVLYFK